jgi:hypothetical protein
MPHVRLVSPANLTEPLRDVLAGAAGVQTVVRQPGGGLRVAGQEGVENARSASGWLPAG